MPFKLFKEKNFKNGVTWTEKEKNFLLNYKGKLKDLAIKLNRSENAIYIKSFRLKRSAENDLSIL